MIFGDSVSPELQPVLRFVAVGGRSADSDRLQVRGAHRGLEWRLPSPAYHGNGRGYRTVQGQPMGSELRHLERSA
jgi:hypothetical protein